MLRSCTMDQLAQCMVPLESDGVGGTLRESDEVEGRPLMDDLIESEDAPDAGGGMVSRKEKRRLAKKAKRKQQRIKAAEELKKEEEALAKDPLCQRRLQEQQAAEEQKQRLEEEQHRQDEARWLEREKLLAAAAAQKLEAAAVVEQKKVVEELEPAPQVPEQQPETEPSQAREIECEEEIDGPPEIIWEGNQITVRKRKVKKSEIEPATKEDGPTHNPLYIPIQLPETAVLLAQAESDADKRELCQFFMRTGACRHFDKCSRKHPYPSPSHVIMIRGMFTGLGSPGVARTEDDANLELTEDEVRREFEEFYDDVLPEFEAHGTVTNLKVCQNLGPHLRGNVYVSYKDKEAAVQAFAAIHGRFYGGKQLVCEYAPFTQWRAAICGIQRTTGRCQHGANCNYLHCFRNPGGAFAQADFGPVDQPSPSRRSRSHSVDTATPYRSFSRREERSVRSPSRGSERHERRREHGRDDRWRSESRGSRGRERSVDRKERDRERDRGGDRPRRRRRSNEGWGSRHRSESRSPRTRRRGGEDREERGWGQSEIGHRERSERRHREGSGERGRWEGQRSRSRDRTRGDLEERSKRGGDDRRAEDVSERGERLSEARESAPGPPAEERYRPDVESSPEKREDVSRDDGDRWQGNPVKENLAEDGSPERRGDESRERVERRSHRSKMRRKERVKSEEGAGSPGKVSRAHSRKKKRREATTEAGVGDADENPAGSLEKAGASLEVDEGRWIPDESHAIAGQAGGFPVASSSEVEGRATAGAALLSVKSRCQEVEAVRTAGDASATGTPTNVDKHLLDLRRAVEQSFKRRRRKSLQADVEMKDDT